MLTTLLNPTLWLLAALAVSAAMSQAAGEDARFAFERVVRLATSRGVLLLLALAAAGGLASRAVLGYLAPGAYAEEVIAARSYVAERQLYHGNDRADFSRWLSEEPTAADPWTLPGLTVCQANAIERRPQFYTSQGHSPVLLLASVPVVQVAGGRALYVTVVAASLLALAGLVAAFARDLTLRFPSRPALLIVLAIAGWQPVFAAIRQGDAVLIVAGLFVWTSYLLRVASPAGAGLLSALSAALFVPASVLLLPVARASTRAFVAAVATLLLAFAATAALGGTMLFVDYAASTIASARLYAGSPITYSAFAKLLAVSSSATLALAIAAVAIAMTVLAVWRRSGPGSLDVSVASFATLAFLLSPVAWSQHVTLLVLPLAVLLARAVSSGRSRMLLAWAAVALLLSLPDPPNLWIDAAVRHVAGESTAALLPTLPTMAALGLWVSMLLL